MKRAAGSCEVSAGADARAARTSILRDPLIPGGDARPAVRSGSRLAAERAAAQPDLQIRPPVPTGRSAATSPPTNWASCSAACSWPRPAWPPSARPASRKPRRSSPRYSCTAPRTARMRRQAPHPHRRSVPVHQAVAELPDAQHPARPRRNAEPLSEGVTSCPERPRFAAAGHPLSAKPELADRCLTPRPPRIAHSRKYSALGMHRGVPLVSRCVTGGLPVRRGLWPAAGPVSSPARSQRRGRALIAGGQVMAGYRRRADWS